MADAKGDDGDKSLVSEGQVLIECQPWRTDNNVEYRETRVQASAQVAVSEALTINDGSTTHIQSGGKNDELALALPVCSYGTARRDAREAAEDDLTNAAGVPFTVRGRVPIRTRNAQARSPSDPERKEDRSVRDDDSGFVAVRSVDSSPVDKIQPAIMESDQESMTPPLTATFIPISSNPSKKAPNSDGTRESRLNELRQKKLQKLQQTREISLRQQKEKRHVQKPTPFLASVCPKKASNRQLMQNALEFTLLAGGSMERERTAALRALADSDCDNFIVLLKSAKELKFRALYENRVDRGVVFRIFSVMPSTSPSTPLKIETSDVVSQFFKYSSAKKQFLPVATRSFTVKTDACALVDQFAKKKPKSSSATIAYLL